MPELHFFKNRKKKKKHQQSHLAWPSQRKSVEKRRKMNFKNSKINKGKEITNFIVRGGIIGRHTLWWLIYLQLNTKEAVVYINNRWKPLFSKQGLHHYLQPFHVFIIFNKPPTSANIILPLPHTYVLFFIFTFLPILLPSLLSDGKTNSIPHAYGITTSSKW